MTFTKEQLIEHIKKQMKNREMHIASPATEQAFREYLELEIAINEIALAALESRADVEPVGYYRLAEDGVSYYLSSPTEHRDGCIPLYTRPQPAPVVPDKWPEKITWSHHDDMTQAEVMAWNNAIDACRAAMLQGKAEPVSQSDELPAKCWCHTCRPVTMADMRFVVCPECGNKRCPHANDHRNDCTGSNEPGQESSAYPAAPQQEAE